MLESFVGTEIAARPVVRLEALAPGEQALCEMRGWGRVEYRACTVLWQGAGSVEVMEWGASKAKDTTRWAPDTPVVLIDYDELPGLNMTLNTEYKEPTMAKAGAVPAKSVANSNVAKMLQTRYDFQQKKLAKAMEEDDGEALEAATEAIEKILGEAKAKGVTITEAENGNGEGEAEEQLEEAAEVAPAKPTKAQKDEAKVAQRNAALAKAQAANKANGGAKKAKKEATLYPCLDGCGAMVKGNFAMGHDAKLKSLLLKVARGEEAPDAIPEPAQEYVKLRKGPVETEKDEKGKVIAKTQTYEITQAPVRFPGKPEITFVETGR